MPLAYKPPMMAPIEVPTIMSTGTCAASSALSTPTCAKPRAPPPESTRATRGRSLATVPWAAEGSGPNNVATAAKTRGMKRERMQHL